jgi:hypothetical protein
VNRRLSWVEWLAFGLTGISLVIFFLGEYIFQLQLPWDDRATATLRAGLAPMTAAFVAAKVAAIGLSLSLVKPLLRLGPRAPLWLIPLAGAVLGVGVLIGADHVCRPFERYFLFECYLSFEVLCPILVVLGTVLLIRKAELSRKHGPDTGVGQSS